MCSLLHSQYRLFDHKEVMRTSQNQELQNQGRQESISRVFKGWEKQKAINTQQPGDNHTSSMSPDKLSCFSCETRTKGD